MISKDKTQVTAVIPNEVLEQLDAEAKEELRTRSQQVAKILIDYFKAKKKEG